MRKKTTYETVQHTRTTLTGKDILRMCKASGRVKVTKDTEVLFNIPTGGDWSGMTIEIDRDNPIIVISKSYDKRCPRVIRTNSR